MKDIQKVLYEGINFLKDNNVLSYNIDAKLILMKVLNMSKVELLTSREKVSPKDEIDYFQLLKKRANGVPVSYITNFREFMSLDFFVNEKVLIPRGDTEILVEKAIEIIGEKCYNTHLDICTGSGCIPISISKHTNILNCIGTDISSDAIEVANKNSKIHNTKNVEFIVSDLAKNVDSQKFDIITSNPPYIDFYEMQQLEKDLYFEPTLALYGGVDGLDFYRRLIITIKELLNDNGTALFEIGTKTKEIVDLLEEADFKNIEVLQDLQNRDRVICFRKK